MNIEREVSAQRDEAYARINERELVREWLNRELLTLPLVVKGEYQAKFMDERGEPAEKTQSKNVAFWLIALQTTVEVGHTTYELLASIFSDWALETLGCEWPKEKALPVAKAYIAEMRNIGVLEEKRTTIKFKGDTGEFSGKVNKVSESFTSILEELRPDLEERVHMVCKPLANKPVPWTNNFAGVGGDANLTLVKASRVKRTQAPAVLEAVNRLQEVPFRISPDMIEVAFDVLDNARLFKPTAEEERLYWEIIKYKDGQYYFPVTMDSRGRMYYRGGIISPQGNDFLKAALQMAHTRPLGEHGREALLIHLANCCGHQALSVEDRLVTAELIITNDYKEVWDMEEAFPEGEPMQAWVVYKELRWLSTLSPQEQREAPSRIIVHQDGTCNGIQHMAVICKDRETAAQVNCTASSEKQAPKDIYATIGKIAADKLINKELGNFVRENAKALAKKPVMVGSYGAGKETINKRVETTMAKLGYSQDTLKKDSVEVTNAIMAAMEEKAGAVNTITDAIKTRLKEPVEGGMLQQLKWSTADGFQCFTLYQDMEAGRIRAGVFNAKVPAPRCTDIVKTVGAAAPNFIHSIDAAHCREVVRSCPWEVVTIHDSIGTHAGNYKRTGEIIRETFIRTHYFEAFNNFCESNELRTAKFRGDFDINEVTKATYLFH